MTTNPNRNKEAAGILINLALWLVPLFAFVGMAVDYGILFERWREMHIATDSSAMAGALELMQAGATVDSVRDVSVDVAEENGLVENVNLVRATDIRLGQWVAGNFVDQAFPYNAVAVRANTQVDTFFSHLLGLLNFTPDIESVALASRQGICIKPFGIEADVAYGPPELQPGDRFWVGNNSPGNWGKLDLPGPDGQPINMSSGTNFEDYMRSGVCGSPVAVGDEVGPGTGNGGPITSVFQEMIDAGDTEMAIAIVSPFQNGNSAEVTILGFAKVELISVESQGVHLNIELEFIEFLEDLNGGGNGVVTRVLVK